MKFKELTEKQIKRISDIHSDKALSWDDRMMKLRNYTSKGEEKLKSERTVRKWTERLGLTKPTEAISPQYEEAKKKVLFKKGVYLIGYAQNNTPVIDKLFTNMESYAKFHNASIHIIAGRYKNPTSVHTEKKYDTWAKRLTPYLDASRHDIHKHMKIMSDVKIQPTAVKPLSGMHAMSKESSCIFGHPKMHMEMIATLEGHPMKMMLTTGSITESNYTDSKAGKKGEFYHTPGFVIVEIQDDEVFHVRQITADEKGNFNDLFFKIKNGEVTRNEKIDSAIIGDLHYGEHDQEVIDSTFDDLLIKLKPKNLILHDIFDGYSITHHDINDPFKQFKKEKEGKNSLSKEVNELKGFLTSLRKYKFKNIVVARANHDDFIDRWLVNTDWRKTVTPKNTLEYMEYATAILRDEAPDGIIPWILSNSHPEITCLPRNGSFISNEWELGQHGDKGSNGSRGSLEQAWKLNTKIIVGHYHTPGRKDGALAVGTSTKLRLSYCEGASSWLHSHVIVHKDGKAQHINFINGKYTTFK